MHGKIHIGDHVMFGPGVHIHGGNHKFSVVGKWMKELTKQEGEDGLVVIQDDVWIGANAIILKNVTIGEGSIIGAGAVVTHDVPPYSIYTGVPLAKLRERFSADTILQHKEILKKRGVLD
ncbi:hypothetical protein INF28_02495 [Oscillospiraceae bacterium DSM 107454]|uniref:Acetyltransferase n=2 Tax=Ructibacterium gallinarum TaxID=2779355 RepID=A0A9D5LYP7_9FIRM|nr:hypothetical protein [Ructibacterium gallinarum]